MGGKHEKENTRGDGGHKCQHLLTYLLTTNCEALANSRSDPTALRWQDKPAAQVLVIKRTLV